MNMSLKIKYWTTLSILICMLSLTSCLQKTVSSKNSSNDSTTGFGNQNSGSGERDDDGDFDGGGGSDNGGSDGGNSYGDGSEEGISDSGQDLNYRTVSNIVVKTPSSGSLFWSSKDAPNLANDQHIFAADQRFNLRIIPRRHPNEGTVAFDNTSCSNDSPIDYGALSIDVCLRREGGSCINTTRFENISVNGASKVKEYTPPSSTQPLIVEVTSVEWDYWCAQGDDRYCPTGPINFGADRMDPSVKDCVRFDIQFSTDETKDLPGPRQ